MTAQRTATRRCAGSAAVGMIVAMVVIQLAVVGLVLAGARDQDLTTQRASTIRAFYAAEAGMNMAIREVRMSTDADGDGAIGSISDDDNAANDPSFSGAQVVVTLDTSEGVITLTSTGRSAAATRCIRATLD